MQGTAAVVLAGLFNALKVTGTRWRDQRVVVFGGGTAGAGIADRIRDQMVRDGLGKAQATARIWFVDLPGLLADDMGDGLIDYQRPYTRPAAEAAGWSRTPAQIDPFAATRWPQMAALRQTRAATGIVALETVVAQVPTILIGTSTADGAFTRQVGRPTSASPVPRCCPLWRTCAPPPRPPRSPSPVRPPPTASPPRRTTTWCRRCRTPCGSRYTAIRRRDKSVSIQNGRVASPGSAQA